MSRTLNDADKLVQESGARAGVTFFALLPGENNYTS